MSFTVTNHRLQRDLEFGGARDEVMVEVLHYTVAPPDSGEPFLPSLFAALTPA